MIKSNLYIPFFLLFHWYCFAEEQVLIAQEFYSYNKSPRTFLLSYPRSANTWTRYWLEHITSRPTFYRFNLKNPWDRPLGYLAGFLVDPLLAPIEKVHMRNEMYASKANMHNDELIIIVRNPKEVLSRHGHKEITFEYLQGEGAKYDQDPRIYFDIFALYNSWNPQKRIMIFYEDLLNKPREVITAVISFLHEPLAKIDSFMENYEYHRKSALSIYQESESQGNDLLYHSKMISPVHRKQIDAWIEQLYPGVWKNYLCERYAEEKLLY